MSHTRMLPLLMAMMILGIHYASADTGIHIMSPQERNQIFSQTQNFQLGNNINYQFSIIITPTGTKETNVILSQDNYTALKNNVAFFTACGTFNNGLCQPPITTTASPTSNYCPLAKLILTNQDGYLSKLYNQTSHLDLTSFVYPVYCHSETGPNPINGDSSNTVQNISVTTDKQTYNLGDTIFINGQTSSSQDVSLLVISPIGNIVTVAQLSPSSGTFTKIIITGGTLWQQSGIYTVKVQQGSLVSSSTFTLASTVPEFPPIAIIVSFVSVLSLGIFLSRKP